MSEIWFVLLFSLQTYLLEYCRKEETISSIFLNCQNGTAKTDTRKYAFQKAKGSDV